MCSHCGSMEYVSLGNLGLMFWLRCRDCGADFSLRMDLYPNSLDPEPDSCLECPEPTLWGGSYCGDHLLSLEEAAR